MKDKAGIGHNYDAVHPKKTKGKPSPADIYAGSVLKALRQKKGFSQEELADQVGITFQQIQKYEKGTNRMSVGRIDQFSKILEVSPIVFFDLEARGRSKKQSAGISILELDKEQQKFIKMMDGVPEKDRQEFYNLTRRLMKMFTTGGKRK